MLLRMPSSQLTNLVNAVASGALTSEQQLAGGGGNAGGLRLVVAGGVADRQPAEYVASNSQITALINAGAQTITPPAGYPASMWLEIPSAWLRTVFGVGASTGLPTSGPLQISTECIVNATGGWETALQALGWTAATPTSTPVPSLNY